MRFQGIFLAVTILVAATAHAAPVTFNFSGVVTRASDYAADVSSWVGMEFTGSYTVDLENAQEPWRMLSRSGCAVETAGVCSQNYGNSAPVITDWSVQLAGQAWQRIQESPYFSSTQSVSTSTVKNIFAGQSSSVRTGDPGTLTVESLSLNILASDFLSGAYSGDHLDAPDLSRTGTTSFSMVDFGYTCRFVGRTCWNSPSYTGSSFDGYLTSWAVVGANEVPEPSTALLIAVALGGMGWCRAKRRGAASEA